MDKVNINKLLLYQRGELNDKEMDKIKNLLRKDKKLSLEYEVLLKADEHYGKFLDNIDMPSEFKSEIILF